jgi:hypothetical protein
MSLLRPEINLNDAIEDAIERQNSSIDFEAVAAEVISSDGASVKKDQNAFIKALNKNNAGLEAAARRISQAVNYPESDQIGLKAAEMIVRAHGLLREKEQDKKEAPQVNITVVGTGGQTMINLLMPKI